MLIGFSLFDDLSDTLVYSCPDQFFGRFNSGLLHDWRNLDSADFSAQTVLAS